jgi:hypothetical protein
MSLPTSSRPAKIRSRCPSGCTHYVAKGMNMGVIDNVVSAAKTVRDIARKHELADLTNAIADLMIEAAGLKGQLADLQDENRKLRQEIADLKTMKEIRSKLIYKDGFYYAADPITGYGTGPFCSRCLDADGVVVVLQMSHGVVLECAECRLQQYRQTS